MKELPDDNFFNSEMNDLRYVYRQLWYGRKTIALSIVLFIIFGGIYALYRKITTIPEYESRVTLHIDPTSSEIISELCNGSAFLSQVMLIPLHLPGTGQRWSVKKILFLKTTPSQGYIDQLTNRITVIPGANGFIKLSVIMQEPELAKQLADSVAKRLSVFFIEFMTQRTQMNIQYITSCLREAEEDYKKSAKALTKFCEKRSTEIDDNDTFALKLLWNESNLKYNIYNDLTLQLERDRKKANEEIPIIKVINKATIATQNNEQETIKVIMIMLFLGITAGTWIVLGQNYYKMMGSTARRNEQNV